MFYLILKNLCLSRNLKLTNVLKELSISLGNTTKWENGTLPNGAILIKFADYFGCSVDYLLGRTDTPQVINFSDGGDFMYNSSDIASKINYVLKAHNESKKIMLENCGLNKNVLYTMQSSGYFPRVETLAKIADYLGVSVDYLLGRTDNLDINK